MPAQANTVEQDPRGFPGAAMTPGLEHNSQARAKKVIDGPVCPAANGAASISPVQGTVAGASASMTLVPQRLYRLIASTNTYVRFSKGASTAVVGDIFLPANLPMNILTDRWDTVSFIQVSAGGIIQALELA